MSDFTRRDFARGAALATAASNSKILGANDRGITAGFHNHPRNVGLARWDGRQVVEGLDPKWIGYYSHGRSSC